jgi:hypothetical protein
MADREKRETCDVCHKRVEDVGPLVECLACLDKVCQACVGTKDTTVTVCVECEDGKWITR